MVAHIQTDWKLWLPLCQYAGAIIYFLRVDLCETDGLEWEEELNNLIDLINSPWLSTTAFFVWCVNVKDPIGPRKHKNVLVGIRLIFISQQKFCKVF